MPTKIPKRRKIVAFRKKTQNNFLVISRSGANLEAAISFARPAVTSAINHDIRISLPGSCEADLAALLLASGEGSWH